MTVQAINLDWVYPISLKIIIAKSDQGKFIYTLDEGQIWHIRDVPPIVFEKLDALIEALEKEEIVKG